MVFQKLSDKFPNYFFGGYISSLLTYEEDGDVRSYMSIGIKTTYKDKPKYITVMVYKLKGYEDKKYPNPSIKIICDCYKQGRPIALVYQDKGSSKIEVCTYTNFSVDKQPENEDALKAIPQNDSSDIVDFDDDFELPF